LAFDEVERETNLGWSRRGIICAQKQEMLRRKPIRLPETHPKVSLIEVADLEFASWNETPIADRSGATRWGS
jgi:hypothetical protein